MEPPLLDSRNPRISPCDSWLGRHCQGHNGLVDAAYLAKAGMKTVLLERRPFVGGATITEELVPGFHFTTFSYAISLLRPDIVQDLNLAEHGLMILPLTNTFQPGFNGEYLFLGADSDANFHEISRHSVADALLRLQDAKEFRTTKTPG